MSDHTPDTADIQPEAAQAVSVDQSRRKLAGAALGASAILTLASRPVMAQQCVTASAAVSGNLSQHGTPTTCSGKSPGYWKQHPEQWSEPYLPGSCSGSTQSSRQVVGRHPVPSDLRSR